jgi:hypothetical protein
MCELDSAGSGEDSMHVSTSQIIISFSRRPILLEYFHVFWRCEIGSLSTVDPSLSFPYIARSQREEAEMLLLTSPCMSFSLSVPTLRLESPKRIFMKFHIGEFHCNLSVYSNFVWNWTTITDSLYQHVFSSSKRLSRVTHQILFWVKNISNRNCTEKWKSHFWVHFASIVFRFLEIINSLNPSGHYIYHTVYLYVPYGSHNKQRLFPQTALTGCAL